MVAAYVEKVTKTLENPGKKPSAPSLNQGGLNWVSSSPKRSNSLPFFSYDSNLTLSQKQVSYTWFVTSDSNSLFMSFVKLIRWRDSVAFLSIGRTKEYSP
jgi:hypothetical protein